MTNNVNIRKATLQDAGKVRKLAEKVWPFTYKDILSPDQIGYMMDLFYSEKSLKEQFFESSFIIAYLGEEAVGFASYSPAKAEGVYKLHKLYVNADVQGRGVGKSLIRFIIFDIQLSNAIALELNVNRNNSAKAFYEGMGFNVIREEDIDIGNGFWMNDYVMRLELT